MKFLLCLRVLPHSVYVSTTSDGIVVNGYVPFVEEYGYPFFQSALGEFKIRKMCPRLARKRVVDRLRFERGFDENPCARQRGDDDGDV